MKTLHAAARAVLLGPLLITGTAQAAANHWVQAAVLARGNGASASADSGQLDGPSASVEPVGFHASTAKAQFDSGITATATFGHLSGSGFASESNDPSAFPVQSDVSTNNAVQFFDTVTLNSASLPLGSPVTISATLALSDDLSGGPTTCCSNVIAHGTQGFSPLVAADQAGLGAHIAHTVTKSFELTWFTGAANPIGGYLLFDAGSSPGCCTATSGSSRVDLADARFTLTLPAGVTLTSASGFDYAAAVPEPASAALLLPGLGLLMAHRLRRR